MPCRRVRTKRVWGNGFVRKKKEPPRPKFYIWVYSRLVHNLLLTAGKSEHSQPHICEGHSFSLGPCFNCHAVKASDCKEGWKVGTYNHRSSQSGRVKGLSNNIFTMYQITTMNQKINIFAIKLSEFSNFWTALFCRNWQRQLLRNEGTNTHNCLLFCTNWNSRFFWTRLYIELKKWKKKWSCLLFSCKPFNSYPSFIGADKQQFLGTICESRIF